MRTPINYKKYAEYDLSILSEKSRNVLQDKIDGLYGWEIQEKYGLTSQQLANTLSNARRKLEGLQSKYYQEHKEHLDMLAMQNPNRQASAKKYYEKITKENPNYSKEKYQKSKEYQQSYYKKRYAENKELFRERNRKNYLARKEKENKVPKVRMSQQEKDDKRKQYMHDYYLRVIKEKRIMNGRAKEILNVKEFRKETGMSQAKFAEHFGIPLRTLQEWEQERRTPPSYLLNLLKRIWKSETTSQ